VSMSSELRALLERLGPIPDIPPARSSSDPTIRLILHRTGPFAYRISVVRRLREAGTHLREAARAITQLASQDWATCPVRSDTDLRDLAKDLAALDVEVRVYRKAQDPAAEILDFRTQKDLSQAEYAALLNLDVRTLQNWEQGRNQPDGAALNLMRAFARAPAVIEEAISEPVLG
jgi:DNA-binding transcriptional regulator YiaG